MNKCLHVIVKGRVQGVYFRDYTKKVADELGIFGWVRNLPNGDVEVLMEGKESTLADMERKLWEGSSSSRVDSVTSEKCEEKDNYSYFKIVY